MHKHDYKAYDEVFYDFKVKDRLNVTVVPKPGFSKAFVSASVPLGSVHEGFVNAQGEATHVPRGVAHFLEHKLFEFEGQDISKAFSKHEASVNAFTDHHQTTYLFSATGHVMDNAKRLLKMMYFPEITEEGVEKEKPIIQEELNMHGDDPYYHAHRALLNNMYTHHPLRDEVLGSKESINAMSKDALMSMHEAYYTPENTQVIIVGDVDPGEVEKTLNETIDMPKKAKTKPLLIKKELSPSVNTPYETQHYDMETPLLMMGFKLGPETFAGPHPIKEFLKYSIALETVFSTSSQAYESLLEKGLVNDAFGVDVILEKSYAHGLLFAETKDVETLRHALLEILRSAKEAGVMEEDYRRVKRKMIGHHITAFDRLESLASEINDYLQFDLYYHDLPSLLESVELEDVNQALRSIKEDTVAFFGGLPKT